MNLFAERNAVDKLHGNEVSALAFTNLVNVRDVRVVECGRGRRLLLEAAHPILVSGHVRRENLQRHFAMEPRIFRQINLTHPAGADLGDDAVVSNDRVGGYVVAQIVSLFFGVL